MPGKKRGLSPFCLWAACYTNVMNQAEIRTALKRLVQAAVHKGPVTLASGKVSDFYIDGRLVTLSAEGLKYTAALMADMLAEVKFDAVGGPTMGADPIVGALLYHYAVTAHPVPAVRGQGELSPKGPKGFIIRKEAKAHGLQKMIEGPELPAGTRVVLVEDVVTSGGSVLKAARAIEAAGAEVAKILALVDREEGAAERLSPYNFEALFTRRDLI